MENNEKEEQEINSLLEGIIYDQQPEKSENIVIVEEMGLCMIGHFYHPIQGLYQNESGGINFF